MKIIVSRENISGGYNENHKIELDIDGSVTPQSLYDTILRTGFLPVVQGINNVWLLKNAGKNILSYFPKHNKVYYLAGMRWNSTEIAFTERTVEGISGDSNSNIFNFEYYPSAVKYGEQMFIYWKGNHYLMWHEGAIKEYENCEVPKEREIEIAKEHGFGN